MRIDTYIYKIIHNEIHLRLDCKCVNLKKHDSL